ncbi:hypothetical protein AKJ08_1762 [Vulgatibacter incomptus]|uniref:Uncharacterized protein n=1 Tax=Vulgatibacter incomptus TaxID=1391653 RepID=A0A0K1PCX7_9BACT|nr:hypothetical protein AKJ08_1762 [Vulgatibacter incomptus]
MIALDGTARDWRTGARRYSAPFQGNDDLELSSVTGFVAHHMCPFGGGCAERTDLTAFDPDTGAVRWIWQIKGGGSRFNRAVPVDGLDAARVIVHARRVDGGEEEAVCAVGGDGVLLWQRRLRGLEARSNGGMVDDLDPWIVRRVYRSDGTYSIEAYRSE